MKATLQSEAESIITVKYFDPFDKNWKMLQIPVKDADYDNVVFRHDLDLAMHDIIEETFVIKEEMNYGTA